jgi:SAM-dependent methyltransferase
MLMTPSCPVCLSTHIIKQSDASWHFGGETYSLRQCRHCGSAFTANLPGDEILKGLYGTCFDYRWYRDHLPAKIKDSMLRLKEYQPMLGKRILDFGGGLGYFSQVARAQGYDSVTYDPFAKASSPPQNGWDTLVALHVLEHANDLDRICHQMKSLLVPGGRIIIAVPNFEGLGYRTLGMRWVWAQPPLIHIFHFTAKGLEALLRRHGFSDFQISYHERWDANNSCDIEHEATTRRRDAAWGKRYLRAIPLYRKLIAQRNTRWRFQGLETALKDYDKTRDIYSELQITAIRSDSA